MTFFTVGFTVLAALLHLYIWVLESFRWNEPATRRTFGVSEEDARVLAPMAFNQGFYNLFLAIGTTVGIAMSHANRDAGLALVLLGVGSMLAAALVLISSDGSNARGAVVQGMFPVICLVLLAIWAWA
jgi:putative membrane protein